MSVRALLAVGVPAAWAVGGTAAWSFAAWAALAALSAWPVEARALTIVTRGEASQSPIAEAYVQPFLAATDIPVRQDTWDGGLDTLRARATEGGWDLVQVDPDELATGCADGAFEKPDWPAVGGKDHYQAMAVSECGVGATVSSTVLAWDRDKFPATPTWGDFWDVAKIPGKRGLARSVRGALEFALLADGVPPNEVYKTLATTEGADRAFRRLDQLKPYVVWWQTGAEAARILASGDVLMTATPVGAIVQANRTEKRNFGVQFAASLFEPRSWAIPKGAANVREALQFLYITGAPSIQARLARLSGDLGLAKGVNEWLTPEQQALSPTLQANVAGALRVDTGFWHDNQAKLKARFETWLGQ